MTLTRGDHPLEDLDVPQVTLDIARSISPEFEGVLSPGTVERCVAETLVELAGGATVVDYLRLLTWRVVNERLRGVAPAQAPPPGRVPEVLLVSGAEPALGVAAAAMLDELAGGRIRIRVAGATDVPLPDGLAGALRAVGLQAFRRRPVPLDHAAVERADVVVTVTGDDACPLVAGRRYVDWQLRLPSPGDADGAAAVVESLRVRAVSLLEGLRPSRPRRRVIPL